MISDVGSRIGFRAGFGKILSAFFRSALADTTHAVLHALSTMLSGKGRLEDRVYEHIQHFGSEKARVVVRTSWCGIAGGLAWGLGILTAWVLPCTSSLFPGAVLIGVLMGALLSVLFVTAIEAEG